MAIYRLLQNSPLEPEDINRLTDAYERALKTLNLKDRSDPMTQLIAKKIIEIGQTGVKDSAIIAQQALNELGVRAQGEGAK